jgi:hypothetical protein
MYILILIYIYVYTYLLGGATEELNMMSTELKRRLKVFLNLTPDIKDENSGAGVGSTGQRVGEGQGR